MDQQQLLIQSKYVLRVFISIYHAEHFILLLSCQYLQKIKDFDYDPSKGHKFLMNDLKNILQDSTQSLIYHYQIW